MNTLADDMHEMIDTIYNSKRAHWHHWYPILPKICNISHRIIWPFQRSYVKIDEHKFVPNNIKTYTWIHKDEYLMLVLKGEI